MKNILIGLLMVMAISSCELREESADASKALLTSAAQQTPWQELWYDGNAEISTYEVQQVRYNDIHPGKTVLIFVTEDFLIDKQVKDESNNSTKNTNVLKTNLVRNFNTGIYDYSIMTSVFTPVDKRKFPRTMKVTTSSQDWCGHSWMQLNHRSAKYEVDQYSYFEKEGDRDFKIDDLFLEDEIFNQIRIDPNGLPTGDQKIIPGTVFVRLKHIELQPYDVQITREETESIEFTGEHLMVYSVHFPEFDRTLKVYYEAEFPYNIAGWEDSYPAFDGKVQTSISKQIATQRMPYWSLHDLDDAHLRSEIGL